jgi:hypothetical protein
MLLLVGWGGGKPVTVVLLPVGCRKLSITILRNNYS